MSDTIHFTVYYYFNTKIKIEYSNICVNYQMKIDTCICLPHPLHEYLLHEILVD